MDGHRVLVTGAGSGIGRATAHLFADEGAIVAVTDLDGSRATTVAEEITSVGGRARAWALDVSDEAVVQQVVAEAVDHGGGLDVLVNNAGIPAGAPIEDAGYGDVWQGALDVMLTAMTLTIRAALAHLRASSAGRIVNVSSTEGWVVHRPRRPTQRPSTVWWA